MRMFQRQFAVMMNAPELRPRLSLAGEARDAIAGRVTGGAVKVTGAASVDDGGVAGMSENRKVSFMDRLLGRQKRRSFVLV